VCTNRARFHVALARLRKTPMMDDGEIASLVGLRYDERQQNIDPYANKNVNNVRRHRRPSQGGLPNQVFLYEVRQIHDKEMSKELSSSIKQYLGIHEDFPVILSYKQTKARAINICDEEHESVRKLLLAHGTDAQVWIEKYFLKSPSVVVSSHITIHRMLSDWGIDPCLNNASFT